MRRKGEIALHYYTYFHFTSPIFFPRHVPKGQKRKTNIKQQKQQDGDSDLVWFINILK